jgi:ribosome-associated protein
VSTKAELRWPVAASASVPVDVRARFVVRYRRRINDAGELVLRSQRYRDQKRNAADCLERLQSMVRAVLEPPKARRPTRASRQSIEERLQSKRRTGEKKRQRRERPQEES